MIADDFVSHDPPAGLPPTKDGFRELAEMVTASISDRKTAPDEFIDTSRRPGGRELDMTATHTGEVFGLPRRGRTW